MMSFSTNHNVQFLYSPLEIILKDNIYSLLLHYIIRSPYTFKSTIFFKFGFFVQSNDLSLERIAKHNDFFLDSRENCTRRLTVVNVPCTDWLNHLRTQLQAFLGGHFFFFFFFAQSSHFQEFYSKGICSISLKFGQYVASLLYI